MGGRGSVRAILTATAWLAVCAGAGAQIATPPQPIPTPPIPASPQLGPVPPVHLPILTYPGRPAIAIPNAPNLQPVASPAEAQVTAADPSDPVKPPVSALLSGPTASVSPGAAQSQIDEIAFIIDPETSQVSAATEAKLRAVAQTLAGDPASRLEIRVFSPSKQTNSQSNARRLSLSRFLALRDALVHAGVAEGRIDGRPLVSDANELNPDRVELYVEH
jgi:outer membrane protein OmpA-like peptidoglycan-associated protein